MQASHWITTLALAGLVALPAAQALGHGELDADHLEEFHRHLGVYEEEIEKLIADADTVVSAYTGGGNAGAAVDGLARHWESVGVHAAIETRATVTYHGIWQALIDLRQSVQEDAGAATVAAAAETLKAALWQAYGALRLAASRAEDAADTPAAGAAPSAGTDTTAGIVDDLASPHDNA